MLPSWSHTGGEGVTIGPLSLVAVAADAFLSSSSVEEAIGILATINALFFLAVGETSVPFVQLWFRTIFLMDLIGLRDLRDLMDLEDENSSRVLSNINKSLVVAKQSYVVTVNLRRYASNRDWQHNLMGQMQPRKFTGDLRGGTRYTLSIVSCAVRS